jgi:hypothetical protein
MANKNYRDAAGLVTQGQKRVALVIGNSNYKFATPLTNPANDATDIAATLLELGFDVIDGQNLTIVQMDALLSAFARRIEFAELALLYYAGHGLQVEGENYLVPIDAELTDIPQLNRQAVKLQDQLIVMSQRARASVLLMDCCRDNPFTRSLARSRPSRGRSLVGKGLAKMEHAEGALVAYATGAGFVAADGEGRNSPFTTALLHHLPTPNLSLTDVMVRVMGSVADSTGDLQRPWVNFSLDELIFLKREELPPFVPPPLWPPNPPPPMATLALGEPRIPFISPSHRKAVVAVALSMVGGLALTGAIVLFSQEETKTEQGPTSVPGTPTALQNLLMALGDINHDNEQVRRVAVARIEAALTGGAATPQTDQLRLTTGLVRMAVTHSRRGMSAQGRFNLFYLLSKIERSSWELKEWAETRANARRALADLLAAGASGETDIGQQTHSVLETLKSNVMVSGRFSLVLLYANIANGGTLSELQARDAIRAVNSLGWPPVLGPNGSPETTRAAKDLDVVRYAGDSTTKAQAVMLTLDLRAAGYAVAEPQYTPAIGGRPAEIWLSKPPADPWLSRPLTAAWCFQRQGNEPGVQPYSVRCHRDAMTCNRVRNGDAGVRSSACAFIPEIAGADVVMQAGGTEDSFFKYGLEPFKAPFPTIR